MNYRIFGVPIIGVCVVVIAALIFAKLSRRKSKESPKIPQTSEEIKIKKQYEDSYYNNYRDNDTSYELLRRTIQRHKTLDAKGI